MKIKKLFLEGIAVGIACVLFLSAGSFSTAFINENNRDEENWNVELIGNCPTRFTYANTLFVQGNYAYVTSHSERNYVCPDYNGALDIFDISSDSPSVVGTLYNFQHRNLLKPLDITVHENYAYIMYQNGCGWYGDELGTYIAKVDVSNPQQPQWYGILNYDKHLIYAGMNINVAFFSSEEYLYVFTPDSFDVYEMPHLDWPVASLPVPFVSVSDLVINNRYAYLLGEIWQSHPPRYIPKLSIIDIAEPLSPTILSAVECARSNNIGVIDPVATSVRRNSRFVYLTTSDGLQIFDATDPQNPIHVKEYDMACPSVYIYSQGRYAYVSSGISGLTVFDVSYPAHPVPTGFYSTNLNASALHILGTTIYAADDISGFSKLSFSSGQLQPLRKPRGPIQGVTGEEYFYQVSLFFTTISNAMEPYYLLWSWGDYTESDWLGPYSSGEIVEVQHSWSEAGEFAVRVKMRNDAGAESPWSVPLFVTIS